MSLTAAFAMVRPLALKLIMAADVQPEAPPAAAPGKLRRVCIRAGFLAFVAFVAVGIFVARLMVHRNFHVVSEGLVYRSGQMDVARLKRIVKERGIKTIVNLRGPAEGAKGEWYFAETNASQQLGVEHHDFSLLAGRELRDEEMDAILAYMAKAPKPILIHCKSGSDRTGLVGALYLYSLEKKSARSSARELSVFCGHVPYLFWRDTIAMDRSFWRYVENHKRAEVALSARPDSMPAMAAH